MRPAPLDALALQAIIRANFTAQEHARRERTRLQAVRLGLLIGAAFIGFFWVT